MRPFTKPSLPIADQLTLLEQRGLVVADRDLATHTLQHISYYRLRAYWLYFEVNPDDGSHQLKPGTTLEDVLALYDFDRRLRLLINDAIERIEVAARGAWAHYLAMKYGPHGYLNAALYPRVHAFQKNLAQLQEEVDRSKDTFIEHYRRTYNSPKLPPIWMAAELMSFGLLSKFLSSLGKRSDKKAIARQFGLQDHVFTSFLHHLATIRNTCAHHGRLWNRRMVVTAPVPAAPDELRDTVEPAADRRIYNSLAIMLHIMRVIAPSADWPTKLTDLLDNHPTGDLAAMGFPANWKQRPLWQ